MLKIKRGDSGIGLTARLTNTCGPVDLTGATVIFIFGKHTITPIVTNPEEGELFVDLQSEHTSETGIIASEFEVNFSDGKIETYPTDGYIRFKIIPDLGGNG